MLVILDKFYTYVTSFGGAGGGQKNNNFDFIVF